MFSLADASNLYTVYRQKQSAYKVHDGTVDGKVYQNVILCEILKFFLNNYTNTSTPGVRFIKKLTIFKK